MFSVMLAAVLATAPTAPSADSTLAGSPRFRLLTVEGVPGDSLVHAEFMQGLDEGLAAPALALAPTTEAGGSRAADSLRVRFRREDDPAARGVWTLQVVVRAPPPYAANRRNPRTKQTERFVDPSLRAARGMTLALLVLSPAAVAGGARAVPDHLAFAFPAGAAQANVLGGVPGGFDFPWREAGRVTATLALELLHHRSGDLDEDARCELSPAVRAGSVR